VSVDQKSTDETAALSISTALVTKLVIEQLLHPALKSAVSAPCPMLQVPPKLFGVNNWIAQMIRL